jgi:UDP-N-acetyl-D-glucosamine dehydrogenase
MRLNGYEPRFIALADEINRAMPAHVVSVVADALNDDGRPVKDAAVLVLGVAYKAGVGDTRESPAHEIIASLRRRGARVAYADPHVPAFVADGAEVKAVELTDEALADADCTLLLAEHPEFDLRRVVDVARLVVDTRNATWGLPASRARVIRL